MRILLIASSAREHAIAEALARSRHKPEIIAVCATANPGIRRLAAEMHVGSLLNFAEILDIARRTKPDFAIVGPEDPIAAGIADELATIGVPTVAPKKSLAGIESSKGFARQLFQKYEIDASPAFHVFSGGDADVIRSYIEDELCGEYVVKFDALKGGKGVKVSGEHLGGVKDGVDYALQCIAECGQVVIEEKLLGCEFSLMSFVSGTHVVDMPAVHDHKRAYEGDTGPNTGGMGTISDVDHSLPFLERSDLARASEINRLTAEALRKECHDDYRGILYGGFMATASGVRVIEYNCRFGDPEALNVLPLLQSDFVDVCLGIVEGKLTDDLARFAAKATVCKYIVPESYPTGKDQRGAVVHFPELPPLPFPLPSGEGQGEGVRDTHNNCRIYFGDVTEDSDGTLRLGGSRTAGIVGIGDSIAEAEAHAQAMCERVRGEVRYRHDIGTPDLLQKRTDLMHTLRTQ